MSVPIHIVSQEIVLVKESFNPLAQITSQSLYQGSQISQSLIRSYDMITHYRDYIGGLKASQTSIEIAMYGKKGIGNNRIVEIGSFRLLGILNEQTETVLIIDVDTKPARFNIDLELLRPNTRIPFEHRAIVLSHHPTLWDKYEVLKFNTVVVRALELRLVDIV
jgi:hypothetical protein